MDHGDAGNEHGGKVIRNTREIEFPVQRTDKRNSEQGAVKNGLPSLGPDILKEEKAANRKKNDEKYAIIDEKVAQTNDDFGVGRDVLPGVGEDGRDARNNHGHHENHDRHKCPYDERRINEGIFCLGADFIGTVKIIGKIEERRIQLARLFAGTHHVHIKRTEYF